MPIGAMDSQCCLWFTEKHAVQTHSCAGQKHLAGEIVLGCVESSTTHGVLEYSTRVCTRLNILIA